jgi:hypothetical protein
MGPCDPPRVVRGECAVSRPERMIQDRGLERFAAPRPERMIQDRGLERFAVPRPERACKSPIRSDCAVSRPERMNSPLELRKVHLRGLREPRPRDGAAYPLQPGQAPKSRPGAQGQPCSPRRWTSRLSSGDFNRSGSDSGFFRAIIAPARTPAPRVALSPQRRVHAGGLRAFPAAISIAPARTPASSARSSLRLGLPPRAWHPPAMDESTQVDFV